MTRAVLDTNVWLSGLVASSGPPALLVDLALKKRFQLVCCTTILDEVERNLIKKFGVTTAAARRLRFRIAQVADVYEPIGTVRVIPDEHADNLVLETAVLGKARYLVTGDWQHLLSLKRFRNVKIVPPALFLSILNGR